jgi:hypothetical protein
MRFQALLLPATVMLLAVQPLSGQPPDGSANRAAIERLAFLVGRWRGEAWMQRGPERVQTGEWREVGEFSRGGTTWTQIMEMRLRRDP